jgi:hypothetical protein
MKRNRPPAKKSREVTIRRRFVWSWTPCVHCNCDVRWERVWWFVLVKGALSGYAVKGYSGMPMTPTQPAHGHICSDCAVSEVRAQSIADIAYEKANRPPDRQPPPPLPTTPKDFLCRNRDNK